MNRYSMEEAPLLTKSEERKCRGLITWSSFLEELKNVTCLSFPMAVVLVSQYLLLLVSLTIAGHLGELSLSGIAIATSITNVTGFSPLFGLAGALETLCGQAYGAGQYQKLGTYTYCAIVSLIVICIPICVLWIFMEKLLILIGQDPEVSAVACRYSTWLMPALFAYGILQTQFRYFQSQSIISPLLLSCCATLCFHIPVCWALVYKSGFGYVGAALAIVFSYWLNVILLALYMKFSSSCEKTRSICWDQVFSGIKEFLRFGIPSSIMLCLEWWTFEIVILLSGILPNSKLETSVLSICLSLSSVQYNFQNAIGVATSIRISNELGAGRPHVAHAVVFVAVAVSIAESAFVSAILICFRHVLGYAFSYDRSVVEYILELTPFLCLSFVWDGLSAIFSGVARGCGWQKIGAVINLGAYYVVALPVAIILCFLENLRAKGLWIGIVTGSTVQAILLGFLTAMTNWQKEAKKTRERNQFDFDEQPGWNYFECF